MPNKVVLMRRVLVVALILIVPGLVLAQAPTLDSTEKARAREMLATAKSAIKSTYYDKTFRGLDLDAHFKTADAKLESATSLGHAYAIIAQALLDFGDSHTFFIPPERPATYQYGWQMRRRGRRVLCRRGQAWQRRRSEGGQAR